MKLVTGLDCPACGGLRLSRHLARGDVHAALHDNAFLLVFGPSLAMLTLPVLRGRGELEPGTAYAIAAAALLWMLLRNLPAWPLKPRTAARDRSRR